MRPDQFGMPRVDFGNEGVMHRLSDVDDGDAMLDHFLQHRRDISRLAIQLAYGAAAVAKPGRGALGDEKVGKARDGDAEMRGRVVIPPRPCARLRPPLPTTFSRAVICVILKPVERTRMSAGRRRPSRVHHAIRHDTTDRLGDQLNISTPPRS
jgi:hypothetical protein